MGTSGTIGYGDDFANLVNIDHYGGLVFKTLTPKPILGNPHPRVCETEFGLINSIGLQNPGIEEFMEQIYPKVASLEPIKIISLAAFSILDFVELVRKVSLLEKIDFIELNVSCPNLNYQGKEFASDEGLLSELLKELKMVKAQKIIVKLSPDIDKIAQMGISCEKAGADALSMGNTFKAMKIDVRSKKPLIHNVIGGYSGPAIKPLMLAKVHKVAREVSIPIIGVGGVMHGEDVVEYLLAGASLVGIGTANLINPKISRQVFSQVKKYLKKNKTSLKELTGGLILPSQS